MCKNENVKTSYFHQISIKTKNSTLPFSFKQRLIPKQPNLCPFENKLFFHLWTNILSAWSHVSTCMDSSVFDAWLVILQTRVFHVRNLLVALSCFRRVYGCQLLKTGNFIVKEGKKIISSSYQVNAKQIIGTSTTP